MGKVIHFEFMTPEPEKEVAFFQSVFGWKIQGWGDMRYWLVDGGEGAGINGAILATSTPERPRVVNTIQVDDLDASIEKALAAGATLTLDKREVPNVGWVAYLMSPTGIMFAMLEPAPGSMPER